MKKSSIAGLIGLSFTIPAISAENINLDDVVVTASRFSQTRDSVLGDVSVIGQAEIERAGAGSITDLLLLQPGVQISSNGGLGKTSNLFIRGTNKDHIVVLVDGLRINSATSGTTAFENIPLAQIEKIEILRGPASSLYGADAIGGVIQIFTKKATAGKPLVYAAAGLGSYNTTTAQAGIASSFGNTRYGINISSADSKGFSAKRNGVAFDSDNDGYRNLAVSANLSHQLNENHELGLQFMQSNGNSDYDCYLKSGTTVTRDGSVCAAKQILRSYGVYSRSRFLPNWQSTVRLGMGIDDSEDLTGKSLAGATSLSQFRTEQRQLSWQNDINLPLGTLTLAYDRLEQQVAGTTRYATSSRDNNGYLASYLLDIGKHAMQASIRNDDNSQFGSYTTGGLGYGYHLTPEWRISASYGSAFKAPTFNQLYFPRTTGYAGNPDLQPETSRNTEVALRYLVSKLRAGVTVFDNKIDNLIVNGDPVKNINQAQIQGVTVDANWSVASNWQLSGNFTTQSPRVISSNVAAENNQLLDRRGNRYGAMQLLHTADAWQWGTEVTGASTRYNNATNTKAMSGYMLLNLFANYRLHPEWKLEARANNILDKDYVLAYTGNLANSAAYSTAGANVFVGLRYSMNP